jgi:hypothetical protein
MFTVYINYSDSFDKYNFCQTSNFESRITLHNTSMVKSTKPYIPLVNIMNISEDLQLVDDKKSNLTIGLFILHLIRKYQFQKK